MQDHTKYKNRKQNNLKICAIYERTKYKICEGTDTLSYTASALSFMLENLGKTVIVTGSQVNQVTIHVLAKMFVKRKNYAIESSKFCHYHWIPGNFVSQHNITRQIILNSFH